MKTTPKSRLTGSRKKDRRSSRKPRPLSESDRLAALDLLDERCGRIETLANLLEAGGDPGMLDWRLAARAGYYIERELSQVKELVGKLNRRTA
jgi:hypothetical protein